MRTRWVVSISSEHDDPAVFGTYSEPTARSIAERFNASADKRSEDDALGSFLYATCFPLRRATITELRSDYGLSR